MVVQGLSPVYTHRAWRRDLPGLTRAAIDVARELGALLMLPASVYNFGETMAPLLREDTAQAASTFKGRMRIASEAQVRAATQGGRFTYPGPLNVPTAWAWLPDMARSFVAVAGRRHQLPAFKTLHFAGDRLTGQDWADALADIAWERGWLPAGGQLRTQSLS